MSVVTTVPAVAPVTSLGTVPVNATAASTLTETAAVTMAAMVATKTVTAMATASIPSTQTQILLTAATSAIPLDRMCAGHRQLQLWSLLLLQLRRLRLH